MQCWLSERFRFRDLQDPQLVKLYATYLAYIFVQSSTEKRYTRMRNTLHALWDQGMPITDLLTPARVSEIVSTRLLPLTPNQMQVLPAPQGPAVNLPTKNYDNDTVHEVWRKFFFAMVCGWRRELGIGQRAYVVRQVQESAYVVIEADPQPFKNDGQVSETVGY